MHRSFRFVLVGGECFECSYDLIGPRLDNTSTSPSSTCRRKWTQNWIEKKNCIDWRVAIVMRKRTSWLFLCFSFHLVHEKAPFFWRVYHRLATEASRFTWGMCYEFCLRLFFFFFFNFRICLVPRSSAMPHTTEIALGGSAEKWREKKNQ